jgi:hypothetical protein
MSSKPRVVVSNSLESSELDLFDPICDQLLSLSYIVYHNRNNDLIIYS